MLYVLFIILAIGYNWRKFQRDRIALIQSLVEAKNFSHREMILSHHFHVFILEVFMALVVAHLISERSFAVGLMGLGFLYILLLFFGFGLYRFFIKFIEKQTGLEIWRSFKSHIIKEVRVSFALIMLPILIYAVINWTFQDGVYEEWGSLWFVGILFNIVFVSVLSILCTVIIMLRLIPNREITEPEYTEIINRRLAQINMPNLRVRWIETDVKNAFVVGLKLLKFSNQTMFVGKKLRTMLTLEEFDAVICHELAHVANRHIHKRLIDLMKNFISVILGVAFIMILVIGFSLLFWGEDASLHTHATTMVTLLGCLSWFIFNYSLLFETIRSHEFEADGFAVMKLGANLNALISSLRKLSAPDEMPEYLLAKTKKPEEKSWLSRKISGLFSTHPDLETRESFLHNKIELGLPYNYYVSSAQRMRNFLGLFLNWKVSVPLSSIVLTFFIWVSISYKRGVEVVSYVQKASPEELIEDKKLIALINSRPLLFGQTLMFYIVKKNDKPLLEHFLKKGADKGRTLLYLAQSGNFEMLQEYYETYQYEINDDEYFLILRKTAQVNFTDGYRYLVNARRFETLNPAYKEDLTKLYRQGPERTPAADKR
jgi:Zn-dependent protease with chaperone function